MSEARTDCQRVLSILRAWKGDWVPNLRHAVGCNAQSRIQDLRRRGYRIEHKRFGRGDPRYRLVGEP